MEVKLLARHVQLALRNRWSFRRRPVHPVRMDDAAQQVCWEPPRCTECDAVLTRSAAGMLCRSCLDARRAKCITCGSDIYGLYKMCLYCHRTKVFSTMQEELRKRGAVGPGQDFASLCRREAWHREREAKRIDDADKKAAITELVTELRCWADESDEKAIADQAHVPIVDRVGKER